MFQVIPISDIQVTCALMGFHPHAMQANHEFMYYASTPTLHCIMALTSAHVTEPSQPVPLT